jgi:hypothetical protein
MSIGFKSSRWRFLDGDIRASSVVEVPDIADLAIIERAGTQFLIRIALTGCLIRPSGDHAVPGGSCDVFCNLSSPDGAFSPEESPFFALTIIFEDADAVFPAVASFLNRERSPFFNAVDRSGIGNTGFSVRFICSVAGDAGKAAEQGSDENEHQTVNDSRTS